MPPTQKRAQRVVDVEVQPPVVQGSVPPAGWPGGLAEEARHNLSRLRSPPQVGAEIAVQRCPARGGGRLRRLRTARSPTSTQLPRLSGRR